MNVVGSHVTDDRVLTTPAATTSLNIIELR